MNRFLALALLALSCTACRDPVLEERANSLGPDPGPYEAGPLHRAGFPCTWCHAAGGRTGPHFDLAGTIYARPGSNEAIQGVQVHLFDSTGKQQTLVSNEVGNFFFVEGDLTLEFPLWVKLEYQGEVTAMQTPIFREASCATCHRDPTSPSTVGRVYLWEDP